MKAGVHPPAITLARSDAGGAQQGSLERANDGRDGTILNSFTAKFSPEPMAMSAAENISPRIHGPFSSALSSTSNTRDASPHPAATDGISTLVATCTIAGSTQPGAKNSQ